MRNLINRLDLIDIQMVNNKSIELEQLGRKGFVRLPRDPSP